MSLFISGNGIIRATLKWRISISRSMVFLENLKSKNIKSSKILVGFPSPSDRSFKKKFLKLILFFNLKKIIFTVCDLRRMFDCSLCSYRRVPKWSQQCLDGSQEGLTPQCPCTWPSQLWRVRFASSFGLLVCRVSCRFISQE